MSTTRAVGFCAHTTWLIDAVVGVMPVGSDVVAEQRVHERRLAVVELAEHDEVEPLGLELRDPRRADVARQRDHADAIGDLGELLEPRDDLALGLLVMFEKDHENTLIRSETCLSMSGRLGLPVGSSPVICA